MIIRQHFILLLIQYSTKEPNTEIDGHFVREKLLAKEISAEKISSNDQSADILTKSLRGPRIQFL